MDKNQLRALLIVPLGRHKLLLKTEQITRKAEYQADLAALSYSSFSYSAPAAAVFFHCDNQQLR